MAVTPDESLPRRVQATIPAAETRADDAWARLQETGSSSGSHPLSELLEDVASGADLDDQADVA